jgi:polyhydroxyalkanoate synthesis regulator phasin
MSTDQARRRIAQLLSWQQRYRQAFERDDAPRAYQEVTEEIERLRREMQKLRVPDQTRH